MSIEEAAIEDKMAGENKVSAKRKRSNDAVAEEELEIDINAPEPPSKKAKRKEKKEKKTSKTVRSDAAPEDPVGDTSTTNAVAAPADQKPERSDYGVWIGNLAFVTTKDDIRRFLSDKGEIADSFVTRVHMPAPTDSKSKAKNKGFAYVDFSTPEMQQKVLALSEKLLAGRKLLIKNAKSFEGRPEKPKEKSEGTKDGKEPTKRVFVGNLGFDVTREDVADLFGQAGEVQDVFLATFEDSGKCKGFGWVRFAEVDAAKHAVRGFVKVKENGGAGDDGGEDSGSEDDGEPKVVTEQGAKTKKGSKTRKVFINRLNGRPLRCEFAEDAQTRYKKRYGKEKEVGGDARASRPPRSEEHAPAIADDDGAQRSNAKPKRKGNADDRREHRRKRHDARTVAPGQMWANAPRASAAIVAGSGKKISFD